MHMPLKKMHREILEVVAVFVVAWLFYQGLAVAAGTSMPIVSVVSGSMEPTLYRGDLLLVTGAATYQPGDIVVYNRPDVDYTIVHRIINQTESGYVIKGDNNPAPDPGIVTADQIKGKIQFAMPLLGYPRLALMLFGI